jgi:two-component sensor histidine kinase
MCWFINYEIVESTTITLIKFRISNNIQFLEQYQYSTLIKFYSITALFDEYRHKITNVKRTKLLLILQYDLSERGTN